MPQNNERKKGKSVEKNRKLHNMNFTSIFAFDASGRFIDPWTEVWSGLQLSPSITPSYAPLLYVYIYIYIYTNRSKLFAQPEY